ncbi:hypothetical protein SCUP515_11945 [Seiridium cupressi]
MYSRQPPNGPIYNSPIYPVNLTGPKALFFLLSADSIGGRIWRIDTRTKTVDVAIMGLALGPDDEPANFIPLGANGLRIVGDYLYFTNSARGTFVRFKIDEEGNKTGDFETIVEMPKNVTLAGNVYDDFTVDPLGNAYISLHPWAVNKVTPDGKQTTFAGGANSTMVKDPTSVVMANDKKSVYVATGGATIGNQTYGGQILQVQL